MYRNELNVITGELVETPLTDAEIAADAERQLSLVEYQRAIEDHVTTVAQQRGYRSDVSCASHVLSTVSKWRDEGAAFVAWRDTVWIKAFVVLKTVENGERPAPTIAELIEELPKLTWPPEAP